MRALTIAILLATQTAIAEINMKNASFVSEWLDLKVEGFEFRRIYNSRSAHLGLFGFGWCSPFEKTLKIYQDVALLEDCEHERTLKIPKPKPQRGRYRVLIGNEILMFNLQGRLVSMGESPLRMTQLQYLDDGRLHKIVQPKGGFFELLYDELGRRVIELRSSTGQKVKYEYSGDDLKAVIQNSRQVRFDYDDNHNMRQIRHPNKQLEIIAYDADLDRVVEYRSVDGCIHRIQYEKESANDYQSIAEKSCRGQVIARTIYRFPENEAVPERQLSAGKPSISTEAHEISAGGYLK